MASSAEVKLHIMGGPGVGIGGEATRASMLDAWGEERVEGWGGVGGVKYLKAWSGHELIQPCHIPTPKPWDMQWGGMGG